MSYVLSCSQFLIQCLIRSRSWSSGIATHDHQEMFLGLSAVAVEGGSKAVDYRHDIAYCLTKIQVVFESRTPVCY